MDHLSVDHISTTSGPNFDHLASALVVYDGAGTLIEANQAAVDILGTRSDELIGSKAANAGWLVTDEVGRLRADALHPALAAIRSGQPQHGVLVCLAGTGPDIWIQVEATPQPSFSGEVSRVVVSLGDVTRIMSHHTLDDRGIGDRILATLAAGVANARLHPEAILSAATTALSQRRPGTWITTLMHRVPTALRVVAADNSDPERARYIEEMLRNVASPPGIANRVIETGQPVLISRIGFDEFISMQAPEVHDYISEHAPPVAPPRSLGLLVVPMRAHNEILGTLGLFEGRGSYPPTERDLEWVQGAADSIGEAIDNAQRYEDAIIRLRRLESLRNVGLAISMSANLQLTLQVIIDQVISILGVDAACVLMLGESRDTLTVVASGGFHSSSMPDYRIPSSEGLPGRVLAGQRIEMLNGWQSFWEFRRRSLFAREGFQAYGAVPLIAHGEPMGVLEVFHRSLLTPDDEWMSFLEAVGTDASVAIAFARNVGREERLEPRVGRRTHEPAPDFSPVEEKILGHLVEGLTNREIAQKLRRSDHTVKYHIGQMLKRAGVGNRTELSVKAMQRGWL